MTLKMALRWKNPDASTDINLRFKDVIQKGYTSGADITPVPAVLQVTVSPFVLVNFDGAVVISDATETLTVTDGQINYIVCRARYRLQDSPILQMQVLTEAAYLADPEIDHLHVVGVVDLSVGGPYASVPTTRIFYENRHSVDQQGRSFWRDPVATFGALPIPPADFNRDGDVRLVLDSGSIYFWDEATSSWSVFDEVALTNHRDFEHHNGITGGSAATTLEPDVAGLDMTVDSVPAGSAYTVNGKFLTSPLAPLTIDPAVQVGALRGLIQVAMDENGQSVQNYRVQKSADPLDIAFARIINISRNHPLGAHTLLYDNIGATLSWASGEPVAVVTGNTYRLFTPTGVDYIDVDLSGAAPGILASDNYDVNASLRDDDHLMVGHWFWDGAATLFLGSDERGFGTLSTPEVHDDFKNFELHPRWDDLRGEMVYSGGAVADLGGLSARVTGPVIAYLEGVRYEVAGAYNGVVLTDNALNYIYVNSTGVLTVSTTAPSGVFATVAEVTTAAGVITLITDTRDPQLILGQATRDAKIIASSTSELRWNHGASRDTVRFFRSGTTDDVDIVAGDLTLRNASIINGAVTASGDITATTNDFVATLGDFIASAGGVTALAGLIRGLNVTSDNDLTVENQSILKNLVQMGNDFLSTSTTAESPRIQFEVHDSTTTTFPNGRVFNLLFETLAPTDAVKLRFYAVSQGSGTTASMGFAVTINAAADNSAALWVPDVSNSSADAVKLEWQRENASNIDLSIDIQVNTAGGSWNDTSWSRKSARMQKLGASDQVSFDALSEMDFYDSDATTGATLRQVRTIQGPTDGSWFTNDGLPVMMSHRQRFFEAPGTVGAGEVFEEVGAWEANNEDSIFTYARTIHHAILPALPGSHVCVVQDLPDADQTADDFVVHVAAHMNQYAVDSGDPNRRNGVYTRRDWHFYKRSGAAAVFGNPGGASGNDPLGFPGSTLPWDSGFSTAGGFGTITMSFPAALQFDISCESIVEGMTEQETFMWTVLEMYIMRKV